MKELEEAIRKYKATHPRIIEVNFDGEPKEYVIDQAGLDIIEAQEKIIRDLQTKV